MLSGSYFLCLKLNGNNRWRKNNAEMLVGQLRDEGSFFPSFLKAKQANTIIIFHTSSRQEHHMNEKSVKLMKWQKQEYARCKCEIEPLSSATNLILSFIFQVVIGIIWQTKLLSTYFITTISTAIWNIFPLDQLIQFTQLLDIPVTHTDCLCSFLR